MAKEKFSIARDARERFDAARTAHSEARELGFSRIRSAFEAAREALLFGVEPSIEKTEMEREKPENEHIPVHGNARMENRQHERENRQRPESIREPERAPPRQGSIWDALDEIGCERETPQEQSASSEAMVRIQERTAEQKQEREQNRDIGLGCDF